ncbi:MAG: hypothetical protein FH758_08755 [Firmicutes bacterium]|nr:hypothetical protein [Bacillota bacterium]
MSVEPRVFIEAPKEKKDKMIKWYGWITIIVLCITPLVFVLLPILMVNTSRIGKILRESITPEKDYISGMVKTANWEIKNEVGMDSVFGELEIEREDNEVVQCSFLKYVGETNKNLPEIKEGDIIEAVGQINEQSEESNVEEEINQEKKGQQEMEGSKFIIKNIRKKNSDKIYTSDPALAVY